MFTPMLDALRAAQRLERKFAEVRAQPSECAAG
jgi:hypothetical protein